VETKSIRTTTDVILTKCVGLLRSRQCWK